MICRIRDALRETAHFQGANYTPRFTTPQPQPVGKSRAKDLKVLETWIGHEDITYAVELQGTLALLFSLRNHKETRVHKLTERKCNAVFGSGSVPYITTLPQQQQYSSIRSSGITEIIADHIHMCREPEHLRQIHTCR